MSAFSPIGGVPPHRSPESNRVTLGADTLSSSSSAIITGAVARASFIIEAAVLTNISGAEGNYAGLYLFTSGGERLYFLAGQIGAGNLDNFHAAGPFQLQSGWSVGINIDGGEWTVLLCGYYTPEVLTD